MNDSKYKNRIDKVKEIGIKNITLTGGEPLLQKNSIKLIDELIKYDFKVNIETNLKKNEDGKYYADEIGTYYIAYTVDDLKYGSIFKVQKIRLINFVESAENDEIISAGGNV